jgi:hypothetical protein
MMKNGLHGASPVANVVPQTVQVKVRIFHRRRRELIDLNFSCNRFALSVSRRK